MTVDGLSMNGVLYEELELVLLLIDVAVSPAPLAPRGPRGRHCAARAGRARYSCVRATNSSGYVYYAARAPPGRRDRALLLTSLLPKDLIIYIGTESVGFLSGADPGGVRRRTCREYDAAADPPAEGAPDGILLMCRVRLRRDRPLEG
ncbi:hypothetical protein EVAR_55941_1 [Eumeta japonica]|uniref:Uncharacterized protein n=1 Tax=Eumeta variegata TaxID=151549 RepID=A0A4C1YYV1_EUMVA|nr:hypothetical protein EVAR_55941_1 [Eumeta japonica]